MEAYKQEFVEFMVESDVLKFGEFTLKSGRKSPFYMNAGAYVEGEQLHRLGLYYARAINDAFGLDFDVVFGPAYKGIPLSVITAMGLSAAEKDSALRFSFCEDNTEEEVDAFLEMLPAALEAAKKEQEGHNSSQMIVREIDPAF